MVETARICNLAVALAYSCMDKPDPLSAAIETVAAYHAVNPLAKQELAVCQSAPPSAPPSALFWVECP